MRRRKIAYSFLLLFLALFLTIAVAFIYLDRSVSRKDFKSRLETAASEYLKRPLTIESLEWKRWPLWQLTGRNVRLWTNQNKTKVLIEAPAVEARMAILSFYKAAIGVSDIRLISPAYTADEDENGRNNLLGVIDDIKNSPKTASRTRGKIFFYNLSIQNGQISIKNSTVTINDGSVGLITGKSRFAGIIKSSSMEAEYSISVVPGRSTKATVQLSSTRVGMLSLGDTNTIVHFRDNIFTIEKTSLACLGGTITVSGSYSPTISSDNLHIVWTSENIDIAELSRAWEFKQPFSGRLYSSGELTVTPGHNYLSHVSGNLSAQFLNGQFPGKKGTVYPYDETRGALSITNGIAVTTEPVTLRHKTMQAAFMGTLDLPQNKIDGKMIVNMFLGTSEIIGKIPLIGDILLGNEKGLLPIWIHVSGAISNPTIDVLSTKAITAPVWNTIANTLKLPGRLLNRLTGK